jgi:hypothetical protein
LPWRGARGTKSAGTSETGASAGASRSSVVSEASSRRAAHSRYLLAMFAP